MLKLFSILHLKVSHSLNLSQFFLWATPSSSKTGRWIGDYSNHRCRKEISPRFGPLYLFHILFTVCLAFLIIDCLFIILRIWGMRCYCFMLW
ncbi:hypothetical protein CsatB_029029 [Cannabis sativa]